MGTSIRLTNDLRAQIVKRTMKQHAEKNKDKVTEQQVKDAETRYFLHLYKQTVKGFEKEIAKVPGVFFKRENYLDVVFRVVWEEALNWIGGSWCHSGMIPRLSPLKYSPTSDNFTHIRYHDADKKFPVKNENGADIIVDEVDDELRRYLDVLEKWGELTTEHNDLERKVRGLVDSCTTSGRLIEIWPMGKGLIEEVTKTYCVSVGKSDGKSLVPLTTEIDKKIFG